MKKQLFVAVLCSIVSTILFSQSTPPSPQWERSQNGSASLSHYMVKTLTDVSGNVYTLSYANEDMVVVKFNSATGVTQSYIYNNISNTNDYPKDFTYDASGNIYIAGYSYSVGSYGYYATIVKFNAAGSLAWEVNYLPDYWMYPTEVSANAIALDASNNIYFTGAINDSLVVGKINNAGVMQMVKHVTIGGTDLGVGNDIALDASGNMYVAGKMQVATNTYDAVAFKLNSSGIVQWTKQITGAAGGDDISINIGVDNSSNSYVLSNIADTSTINLTPYLTKYNASGAQQYQKKLHTTSQMNSEAVELIVDNLGNSYSAIYVTMGLSTCYSRVIKHSSSGTQNYDHILDVAGNSVEKVNDIFLDVNNNIYGAGQTGNSGFSFDNIFCSKISSAGSLSFVNLLTGSSLSPSNPAFIVADASGFMNMIGAYYKIFNARLNNTGVFQFEGVYAGEANTYDKASRVFTDGNHSVYSLGYVTNDNSNSDAVLSKYDAEGNIQWQNMIDVSNGYDESYDMGHDSVFNIYVTKQTSGGGEVVKYDSIGSPLWSNTSSYTYRKIMNDNAGNSYLATNNNLSSSFTVKKIDPSGNTIFETIGSTGPVYTLGIPAMALDGNDRIYSAGLRVVNFGTANPISRVIVEKFSPAGNSLWLKELTLVDSTDSNSQYYTFVNKVLVDGSNNVYVMGNGYDTTGFGEFYSFVTKFDNNGTQLWQQLFYGGFGREVTGTMEFVSNGELAVFSGGYGTYFIRRISRADGSLVWENSINSGSSNTATVLKVDANENYYGFGEAVSQGSSERDLVLMKFDPLGNLLWYTTKSGSLVGNDFGRDMDVTANGRIYCVAEMNNSSGSLSDLSLLKFCDIATPTISTPNNFTALCPGSNVTITANGGASSSYLWSPGNETTDQITVNAANDYFATITKNDGCFKNTDTIHLTIKPVPAIPEICLVSVDSISTHNIIVWDKSAFTGVDSVKIYREDVTNVYTHIGTVDNDSLSEYHDLGVDPNTTTKRYKISAIDSCGQESVKGNYHNTIYIIHAGNGQFTWNPVYTIENTSNPVNNYLLMRDDNSTGNWTQVASTAGTQNTIVAPTFSSFPNASYRVETAWGISCTSTRGAINTSRSNIKSPSSLIGLNEIYNAVEFTFVPNPANDQVEIRLPRNTTSSTIEIYNTLGQKVLNKTSNATELTIDITLLQSGTYFVKVYNENGSSTKKLIKN
ncbi:MAG: T9SS type A sorting domain-containing protein [Bacteroidota bacterium]|nr:T9SS type A sorting domain-containing protein [Bacteroidota bacterium]